MNNHRIVRSTVPGCLVMLLLFLSFPPCVAGSAVTITDALGREVTLDKPAERIGFTSYTNAEAIVLAGAWDKVVARDGYISDEEFYPGYASIPAISTPDNPYELDYEKIMEIRPDIMILPVDKWSTGDLIQEMTDTLEPEVPVAVLNLNDPETFAENLEKLAALTGKTEQAERYLSFYHQVKDGIAAKTSSLSESEKPVIFFQAAGYTPEQFCTYGGEETMANQMFDICGISSVSTPLTSSWTEVDPEWLIGKDYDAIVVQCWDLHYPETFGYTARDPAHKVESANRIIAETAAREVYANTRAIKENRIYLMHDPLTCTPRFIVGMAYLAKWFHPDLFPDLDPVAIHREYLGYIGAEYDPDTTGLSAYP